MWLRCVQVIVTNAQDASKKTVFEKHAIEFEVKSMLGWGADTATINIYNLALEEIKALQNKKFGELLIEIRAGYADEMQGGVIQKKANTDKGVKSSISITDGAVLPTIFSGVIKNAIAYKRVPDHITTLFCLSKSTLNATTIAQIKSIPPGTKLRDAIKSMCADYGFHTISTYGVTDEEMDVILPTGRVFHDTFINEFNNLLGEHNMQGYIATAEVQIFSETYGDPDAINRMTQGRKAIPLDPNRVQGNPIAGIGTFDVNLYLSPDIQPGMVVDIAQLLGQDGILASGVVAVTNERQVLNYDDSVFRYAMSDKYQIISVIHRGMTHGPLFQTSLHTVLGGNAALGLDESDWDDLYRISGMAEEVGGFI